MKCPSLGEALTPNPNSRGSDTECECCPTGQDPAVDSEDSSRQPPSVIHWKRLAQVSCSWKQDCGCGTSGTRNAKMIYHKTLNIMTQTGVDVCSLQPFLVSRSINTHVLKTVQVFNIPRLQTILQNRFDRFAQRLMHTRLSLSVERLFPRVLHSHKQMQLLKLRTGNRDGLLSIAMDYGLNGRGSIHGQRFFSTAQHPHRLLGPLSLFLSRRVFPRG